MKLTPMAALVLVLMMVTGVKAQQFDLSKMTCDDYLKGDKDTVQVITAWIAGFYTEETDPQTIDLPTLSHLHDRLVTFCTRETAFPIKSAAEGILDH